MSELSKLYPSKLWEIFSDICAIPHPSGHEAKLVEYVKDFCNKNGLEYDTDEVDNVVVRKPATPGMENRKTICMQGHLDMVPQKNSDVDHDFEKDPIKAYIDGDWVTADGTTLGADNGIGVAASLAIMITEGLEHGPLEALLTIDEEAGMTGAFALKPGFLKGDILMNLDSEDEGELYIGCAGGMDNNVDFTYSKENVPAGMVAYKMAITGLKGGHSGMDIILGRGNANKVLFRILWDAERETAMRIASVKGGSLRNAIPREAFAEVVVPAENSAKLEALVNEKIAEIKKEYLTADSGLSLDLSKIEIPASLMNADSQQKLIKCVYGCPNGIMSMDPDMHGVVQTSTNLAIINVAEGKVEICALLRSSLDSSKDDLGNMMRSVFELADANVVHEGTYPGWKPNVKSPILSAMKDVYNDNYGKVPEVKVIHAGLECGLIGDVYPEMDLISFGPTIRFPHSPDEKVNIDSVKKFWDYLVLTLKNAPVK